MFSSIGNPTQFDSSEEVPDTFILLLERKYVGMAYVSE